MRPFAPCFASISKGPGLYPSGQQAVIVPSFSQISLSHKLY